MPGTVTNSQLECSGQSERQGLDPQRVAEILDQCLMTDLEYSQGPEFWGRLEDPLPAMELAADDDEMIGATP